MIRLIWNISIHTRILLRRYMPTNRLIGAIRTRTGLKWGIPAMFLAIPYLTVAGVLCNMVQHGAPGCLNILVLIAVWDAFKMIWVGPTSLFIHLRVRGDKRKMM